MARNRLVCVKRLVQFQIPAGAIVFLTIAQPYKYEPAAGLDYFSAADRLLQACQDAYVIAVGLPNTGRASALAVSTHGRFRAVGTQRDMASYHAATDIYLESIPVGSLTVRSWKPVWPVFRVSVRRRIRRRHCAPMARRWTMIRVPPMLHIILNRQSLPAAMRRCFEAAHGERSGGSHQCMSLWRRLDWPTGSPAIAGSAPACGAVQNLAQADAGSYDGCLDPGRERDAAIDALCWSWPPRFAGRFRHWRRSASNYGSRSRGQTSTP